MKVSTTAYVFLLLLLCPTTGPAQNSSIAKIAVESRFAGLSISHTEVLIIKDGNGYRRDHDRVDAQLVEALQIALSDPPIFKLDLQNLGVNQAWLDANAVPAMEKFAPGFDDAAPNQKALYHDSFTNRTLVEQVVPRLFSFDRTDDYPSVEIEVTFDDGSKATVRSTSQYLFMLPWKVTRSGKTFETYDANISRAVAAVMPKKATNRSRIAGEGLDRDLAEAVMQYIEKDWKLLGVENHAGRALATLRAKYSVVSADINPYHDVAYGVLQNARQPFEQNLHVVVTQKSFPENLTENAILLYSDGKVFGTEDFLQNAGKYEQLVLSVPWLNNLMARDPAFKIQLLWVHDRSFSEKAMKEFTADMVLMGRDALVDEVRAKQDEIALVTINYGDYWLVLPDERMILWRFSTVSGLLHFQRSDFSIHNCLNYGTGTGGCVGATILPNGTLKK